jgi:hypothetical protein
VNPARDVWHSAGDLGLFEDAEPEPWERTTEDPDRLEVTEPSVNGEHESERDHDERSPKKRRVGFFGRHPLRDLSPAVCVSARISPWLSD